MSDPSLPAEPALAPPAAASRFGRWLPIVLGLGLAALGLGALAFAQSGLEIRPAQAPSEGPDPIALLRDDVATLQNDLAGLSKGIGTNLEALGTALDTAAEERHTEQAAANASLAKRVKRLESSLAGLAKEEQKLRAELSALRTALAQGGGAAGADASLAAKPEDLQPGPQPKPKTQPEAKPDLAEREPAPAPRPKKRRRSLFSFKMAGGGPNFSERQRYTVIPSLSRVGFDAKSTLHDFSGVTSKVEGSFTGILASTDPEAEGKIRALVADLRTGVDGRDEEMRKLLGAAEHPHIQFDLSSIEVSESDTEARTSVAKGLGTFTIRGKSVEVTVPLKVSVDASKRLVLAGEVSLDLRKFEIEVPDMGAIGMKPEVKVWLSLRLRALGKAGK